MVFSKEYKVGLYTNSMIKSGILAHPVDLMVYGTRVPSVFQIELYENEAIRMMRVNESFFYPYGTDRIMVADEISFHPTGHLSGASLARPQRIKVGKKWFTFDGKISFHENGSVMDGIVNDANSFPRTIYHFNKNGTVESVEKQRQHPDVG